MFFLISKIFWPLISPANLIFLLLAAGLFVSLKWARAGMLMIWGAFLLFVTFGILPTGHNLLYSLETRYVGDMPDKVDGILVLGGAVETRVAAYSGKVELNEGAERLIGGLRLSRLYPDATFVFSGGSGLLLHGGRQENVVIAQMIEDIGFESRQIIYEYQSRNTYENITRTKSIISPASGETWLLVTSAYHMPRAMAVAKRAGWQNIVPYPVDYRSAGKYSVLPKKFDVVDYFYASLLAIREYVGIIAYKITGKL